MRVGLAVGVSPTDAPLLSGSHLNYRTLARAFFPLQSQVGEF